VTIIDPAPAVARRTAQLLDARGLRAEAGHRPEYGFLTFADAAYGERLRRKAFACDVA
jgi:glutamate racemase